MADISKIKLPNNSEYDISVYTNHIKPMQSKTFTDVIGTANNWANAVFFFGSVKPDVWNEYWRIKYKIRVHVPGQTNYNQMADVMISGRAGDFKAYYSLNTIGAYYVCYYHELYRLKEAGFNSGYGHSIGVRFYSAYNPIDPNYKRTIEVEILETENCSFDFYDNCLKYSEIPGTGTTNYNTYTEMDFVTNGLQETGDANDANYQNREYYGSRTTKNALYRYQFCVTDSTGQLIPINSVNNSVATNKTLMTDAFDPFGDIFYWASTSTYAAGANVGNGYFYRQYLADLRYSFNCGGYDVASTLTSRLPLYLVAVLQSDGTVKLHSDPLAQTLPTSDNGLLYIYLGRVYEDSKPYRLVMSIHHPIYWYKDGAVRHYAGAPIASTSAYGITKLSTSVASTATNLAATSSAVKQAYDKADLANTSVIQLSGRMDDALVYNTSYTVANGYATFTAKVYNCGEDVTSQYSNACFTWFKRTSSGINQITGVTGPSLTVDISSLGYGANIIGRFDSEGGNA